MLFCSLERVHRYIGIEQEAKPTPEGIPPAYWPASGDLVVEKLSARYSPDGADVLRDISFKIKSGERIGVGKCPICVQNMMRHAKMVNKSAVPALAR